MPGPTTRSKSYSPFEIMEEITDTNDPIQKHFLTDPSRVFAWRLALHERYLADPAPGISASWEDRNKNRKPIDTSIQPPYPEALNSTLIHINDGTPGGDVTITIFYTSYLIRVQGKNCKQWIDDDFLVVQEIVEGTVSSSNLLSLCPPSPQTPSPPRSSDSESTSGITQPPTTQHHGCTPPQSPQPQATSSLQCDTFSPSLELASPNPSPLPTFDPSSDVTIVSNSPIATPNPLEGESSEPALTKSSTNPSSAGVTDRSTSDDISDSEQTGPASPDRINTVATPSCQTHSLSPADIASPLFLSLLQQLTEATACIQELKAELQTVKCELAIVQQQYAVLNTRQEKFDSDLKDSEAKFKHGVQATDLCLQEHENSTASAIEKLTQEHKALTTQVTKLSLSKDTQGATLRELKKQTESLSSSLYPKTPLSVQLPEANNEPAHFSSISRSGTSDLDNVQHSPATANKSKSLHRESTTSVTLGPTVTTQNRFAALSDDHNDPSIAGLSSSQAAEQTVLKTQYAPPPKTPYNHLCAMNIRHQSNVLLLGDSIMKRVNERKMSSSDYFVQNLAVSGLSVEDLSKWLANLPPSPLIRHVVFHVGINSCRDSQGPVTTDTWLQLIRLVTAAFPRATLQASSIVPPFSSHHALSRPARQSNANLKQACRQTRTQFVDHTSTFLTKNGAPKQVMYRRDNTMTHPSDEGTKLIALKIRYGNPPRTPHHQPRDPPHTPHQQPRDARWHGEEDEPSPAISRNGSLRGESRRLRDPHLMSAAAGQERSPIPHYSLTNQTIQPPPENVSGSQPGRVQQGLTCVTPQFPTTADFPPLLSSGTGSIIPPAPGPSSNAWGVKQGAAGAISLDPPHMQALKLLAQLLQSLS